MALGELIQPVKDYLTANPNIWGLLVVALGILMFIGAILKWEWLLSANQRFSLIRAIFGARVQVFIYSIVIIAGGILLFLTL